MKGMFEYHGRIEGLKRELEEYGAMLEEAYRDILGEELIDEFIERSRNILTPEAFKEVVETGRLAEDSKNKPGFGITCCSYLSGAKDENPTITDGNGNVVYNGIIEFHTTPIFSLPEVAFEKSELLPRYLSPFLHEYNHFVQYVLQEYPIQAISLMPIRFLENLGYRGKNMIEIVNMAKKAHPHFIDLFNTFFYLSEGITQRMDIDVWEKFGYKRDDIIVSEWQKRIMSITKIERIDDDYFMPVLKEWQKYNLSARPFVRNFMRTFPNAVRIYKHPLWEYERLEEELTQ